MAGFISKYKHFLQIAVSLILLGVLVTYIDFQEAKAIFSRVAPGWVLCVIALYIVDRMLMAWKWGFLLKIAAMRIPFFPAFRMYYLSCFWGFLFPFGVGPDIIRFFKIREEGYQSENATATIITERVLGLVATLLMVLVSLAVLVSLVLGPEVGARFRSIFAGIVLVLAGTLLFIFYDPLRKRIFRVLRINQLLAKIRLDKYFAAFAIYRFHKLTLVAFIFWSFIEQLVPVFAAYFAAKALGIPLTLLQCLAFAPVSIFFERLPISFMGLGVREGTYVLFLQLMGVDYTNAFLLSIFMFITDILSLLPAGLWSLIVSFGKRAPHKHAETGAESVQQEKVPI